MKTCDVVQNSPRYTVSALHAAQYSEENSVCLSVRLSVSLSPRQNGRDICPPQFLEHCYVKRHQAGMYKKQREAAETSWSEEAALLQVDFSENCTCRYQDEIQSAHWQQSQVSLFTAAIWYAGKLHPTVIVSDNTIHAKETVVAYISKLLLQVKACAPESLKTVHIWSDGPASQFKNRYIAVAIVTRQKMTGLQIEWNFFTTSHGKGPVDGIGGSVKRHVWLAVKSCKHVVTNA